MTNYNDLSNSVFGYTTSLSSNWKGTCNLIEEITYFKNNYTNNLSLLNSTMQTSTCASNVICHKSTQDYFDIT